MQSRATVLISLLFLHAGIAHAEAGQDAHHHAHSHAHHAAAAADARMPLELTPDERAMILEEMRLFLEGVQKMTYALSTQDMHAAARSARSLGRKMVHEVPPALRTKLPAEFRQLGAEVHGSFDQMAMDAESLKDVSHTLSQLSATLQRCTSCHATYRIQTPPLDGGR